MWKKTENETPAAVTPPSPGRRSAPAAAVSTLGPSILIKGDLTGEEDLTIQGRLEGEVRLEKNNVTVGQSGHIKADIYGRSIRVEGAVEGNLYGGQEVVIRASGRVKGNIVSPSVTLENGSKFKGAIDMEPGGRKSEPASRTEPKPAPSEPKPMTAAAETAAPGSSHG